MQRWCQRNRRAAGAVLTLDQGWRLAQAWFTDRRAPAWHHKTADDIRQMLQAFGLTSAFWEDLRA